MCLAQAGRLGAGLDGRRGMKARCLAARAFALWRATVKLRVNWEGRPGGRQELTAAEAATQASARETARKIARKLRLATNCARARDRVEISIMARSVEPVT